MISLLLAQCTCVPLTVSDQLEWFVQGFVYASIPCAVALMIRLFRASAGGGEV